MSTISQEALDDLRAWVQTRTNEDLAQLMLWATEPFSDREARHNAFRIQRLVAEERERRREL